MTYNQFLKYELGFSDEQIAEMNEQLKEETAVSRTTTMHYSPGMITGPAFIAVNVAATCARTKKTFKYKPKEDITTFELANLLNLFTVLASSSGHYGAHFDVSGFVESNNLQRHFEIS